MSSIHSLHSISILYRWGYLLSESQLKPLLDYVNDQQELAFDNLKLILQVYYHRWVVKVFHVSKSKLGKVIKYCIHHSHDIININQQKSYVLQVEFICR